MKKTLLILFLIVITSLSALRAQTYISGFSSYIDENGEWTEWIEENVEIEVGGVGGIIQVFDPLWLSFDEYKIISIDKGAYDEDKDFFTVYHCKGENDDKWTITVIDLVTTDPGKLQITFSGETETTAYHVMKAEEE